MPTEILMPALSPTMEEGKLAKWLVKEGQSIKPGDIIAEIETDKATMEVEAVDEGKVSKLLVEEGTEGVKVNTPIAVLLAEGEKDGAPTVARSPSPPAAKEPAPRAPSAPPASRAAVSAAPAAPCSRVARRWIPFHPPGAGRMAPRDSGHRAATTTRAPSRAARRTQQSRPASVSAPAAVSRARTG